jgi:hypothetical protein
VHSPHVYEPESSTPVIVWPARFHHALLAKNLVRYRVFQQLVPILRVNRVGVHICESMLIPTHHVIAQLLHRQPLFANRIKISATPGAQETLRFDRRPGPPLNRVLPNCGDISLRTRSTSARILRIAVVHRYTVIGGSASLERWLAPSWRPACRVTAKFGVFARSPPVNTGLGLAFSREIVEGHGGHI